MSERPFATTPPPAPVREVSAFLHVAGRDAGLAFAEHGDGSWAVELNPAGDHCDGILYLPAGSTAGDALGGLLAMVAGRPAPPPDPGAEPVVGPTYGGLGALVLREGTDGEHHVSGDVRVEKVGGAWAVALDAGMRERLDRIAPAPAPVAD